MAMGRSSRRSGHGRRALRALWRPQGNACTEKRSLCRIMGQRDKIRQAQDAPGTFAVVQTDYLRGVAMGKAVARILPLQRTAPDGAVLAQGMRYTASKPIVKGAYDGEGTPLGNLTLSLGYPLAGRAPQAMLSDGHCRMADIWAWTRKPLTTI